MRALAEELRSEVDAAYGRLAALTDARAGADRGVGKWTGKEVLGHLIDSAVNNHQRFVRAQLTDQLTWPGYEPDAWVDVQQYRDRGWHELLDLWAAINRHVAHVIDRTPESALQTRCVIGSGDPETLDWLMRDYLRHLRHHLAQILA